MSFIKKAWDYVTSLWPSKNEEEEEQQFFFQLRAEGPGQSVRWNIVRVDNVVYSTIEKANEAIPAFTKEVTRLRASRYDAISPADCRVNVYPMPIDDIGFTSRDR